MLALVLLALLVSLAAAAVVIVAEAALTMATAAHYWAPILVLVVVRSLVLLPTESAQAPMPSISSQGASTSMSLPLAHSPKPS